MSMHAHREPDDGEQRFLDFLAADLAASGSFRRTAKRARMALLWPERGSADRPPEGWSTLLTGFLLLAVDAVVLDAAVRLAIPGAINLGCPVAAAGLPAAAASDVPGAAELASLALSVARWWCTGSRLPLPGSAARLPDARDVIP